MGTQVAQAPALPERVFFDQARATEIFVRSQVLVVDDVVWDADMARIRAGLTGTRRKFKADFRPAEPDAALLLELERLGFQADQLVERLYPGFEFGPRRDSWRPMITGPEPLHFDTYQMRTPMVTSFINVSTVARVYCIGQNLEELVRDHRELMRHIFEVECGGHVDDLSNRLRRRTMNGLPPLGKSAPRHRVEFAPGAIWFFNAKTVSHEVVYGEGAMSFSWPVLNSDKPMQQDIMAGL